MSIIEEIKDPTMWEAFKKSKETSLYKDSFKERKLIARLDRFMKNEGSESEWIFISGLYDMVKSGEFLNHAPFLVKREKADGSTRDIFYYTPWRQIILKFIAWRLNAEYDKDGFFSDHLYSYRSMMNPGRAVRAIRKEIGKGNNYIYKGDIHNYFNSIPLDKLGEDMKENIPDSETVEFLLSILSQKKVYDAKKEEQVDYPLSGAKAGLPFSAFLANFYLRNLDKKFDRLGIPYYRYADDILFLSDSVEKREEGVRLIDEFIHERGLEMNEKKVHRYLPQMDFVFLGFHFIPYETTDGERATKIDLDKKKVEETKSKIKAYSHKLRTRFERECMKQKREDGKRLSKEETKKKNDAYLKRFNEHFNRIFYGKESGEVSWKGWYFPSLTTSESLKELDAFLQSEMRYLRTGHHHKNSYQALRYEQMKAYGYKPLVSEYYRFREEGREKLASQEEKPGESQPDQKQD